MAVVPVLQPLDHSDLCVHSGFSHDAHLLSTVPPPGCLPLRQPLRMQPTLRRRWENVLR